MYYGGNHNYCFGTQIGVAFSHDGVTWIKNASNPIITPVGGLNSGYGAGLPTAYVGSESGLNVWVAWYDSTAGGGSNFHAYSTDGVHFVNRVILTSPTSIDLMDDIAHSAPDGYWYIPTMSGNQTTSYVYHTATYDLNSTPTLIGSVSTSNTGNAYNTNPGFYRLPNGDLWNQGFPYYHWFSFGTGASNNANSWQLDAAYFGSGGQQQHCPSTRDARLRPHLISSP